MASYATQVVINGSKNKVFLAIAEKVQDWWGYTDTGVEKVGDIFTTSFGETFWTFKILVFEPYKRIVWQCIKAKHLHGDYQHIEKEWLNTRVEWSLKDGPEKDQTTLYFNHLGLTPDLNCYDICYPAWENFVTRSLKHYVETGIGMPALI